MLASVSNFEDDSLITRSEKIFNDNVPEWAIPKTKKNSEDPVDRFLMAYLLTQLFASPSLSGRKTTLEQFRQADIKQLIVEIHHRSLVRGFLPHVAKLYQCPVSALRTTNRSIKFHSWVTEFGKTLRYQVREKQVAVQDFLDFLPTFAAFSGIDPTEIDIRAISGNHVRVYFKYLERRVKSSKLAANTAHHYSVAITQFFNKWARKRGVNIGRLSSLPQEYLCPSDDYWLPEIQDASRFFASVLKYSVTPEQDFAIFGLLYTNGLRPGEVLKLKWSDLDLNEGLITFQEKGHRYVTMAVTQPVIRALKNLSGSLVGQCLFLSTKGKALTHTRLSALMLAYSIIANWPIGEFTTYVWRHAFVTGQLMTTKDYLLTSRLARHHTFWITTRYTHLRKSQLIESALKVEEALELGHIKWEEE